MQEPKVISIYASEATPSVTAREGERGWLRGLACWAAAWLGWPVAGRGKWRHVERRTGRAAARACAWERLERAAGEEQADAGPKKERRGIPFSFYLKCFSNVFSNPFETI